MVDGEPVDVKLYDLPDDATGHDEVERKDRDGKGIPTSPGVRGQDEGVADRGNERGRQRVRNVVEPPDRFVPLGEVVEGMEGQSEATVADLPSREVENERPSDQDRLTEDQEHVVG